MECANTDQAVIRREFHRNSCAMYPHRESWPGLNLNHTVESLSWNMMQVDIVHEFTVAVMKYPCRLREPGRF